MTVESPTRDTQATTGGFRHWVRRVFWRPQAMPPRVDRNRELQSPAKGDGFDFTVRVHVTWRSPDSITLYELQERVRRYEVTVWEDIEGEVRGVARRFPPNQPAEAEQALAENLRCLACDWRPDGGRADRVYWRARVGVDPAEPVKQLQQEFWAQRLKHVAVEDLSRAKQAGSDEFARERVKQLRDLVGRWRLFLGDLNVDNPDEEPAPSLAPHLARLAARPGEAAETVDALARDWNQRSTYLLRVVEQAIVNNQNVNTYEFLTSYESALKLLLEHIGSRPIELGEAVLDGGSN
jgi:hypothetical protein